jgi:hypothetical protein
MKCDRYNEIINELYENYLNNRTLLTYSPNLDVQPDYDEPMSKDMFIYGLKTNKEFSEMWGLKIEELTFKQEEQLKQQLEN